MSAPPRSVQLTFGGGHVEPTTKPRAGCIGKVQRLLCERPWLTAGEIAEAVQEPSSRVSECLNKLKHEGHAEQRPGLGRSRRSVWSGTSDAGRAARETRLVEVIEESDWEMGRKLAERLPRAFLRAGAGVGACDA